MDENRRKRRDFLQNMVIALLSVSAAFLFTQTQIYNLGINEYNRFFSASASQTDTKLSEQSTGISAPVRVAVTGPYGRYASVTLTTDDERFDPLGKILGEVLGSARAHTDCTSQTYLEVLRGTSVYYDFLNPLPLSVLAELAGTVGAEDTFARSLVVADGERGVELYLWNGGEDYRCYTTAVSSENLEEVINGYELGNARFAFDGLDEESTQVDIAPYALFLEAPPELPVLAEAVPAFNEEALLAVLQFNPNTKSRYTEAGGTEVIMESGRALRLRKNGTVVYQGSEEETLLVAESAGENYSLQELVTGSGILMDKLVASAAGDMRLYLEGVDQDGSTVTLTYGYQVNGVPVCFSDGASAGEVVLSGTAVSSLTLRLRQYTVLEETSLLLPLRQALAIAGQYRGAEMFIGYASDGSGRVSACWLAE